MSNFFLFLCNLTPNYLSFRLIKQLFLKLSGVNLKFRSCYVLSPIYIDRMKKVSIGKNVFINKGFIIEGNGDVNISDNCHIGPRVTITTSNHSIQNDMEIITKSVLIRDNVWIGASVTINPGVTLGPNLVVASGSVVTKNFENCTIAGVPARNVKNHV